jgi:carboxypeptidase family protein
VNRTTDTLAGSGIFILLVAVSLSSCGDSPTIACTAIAKAGLEVRVINDQTQQEICDATVTAIDGNNRETLTSSSCRFIGAFERPGTYVIRAERSGFASREVPDVRVVMGTGDCPHVETVSLKIGLRPQ